MADDLKRVGIKLTAEGARDFKSELKECTAATKENYSELKLAQSQYDKNTTATKKLQDRQKYLASQSDVYKDKVKILNAQLEEMEKAENRDEVAISKKRAELNQAQAKLNEYEKSLEDVNKQLEGHSSKLKEWGGKLQDAGGKLNNVSDKMKSVGSAMTTYVTAPIVAGAAGAVAAFNEIDNAEDILIQKTGAQGKAFEDMKGIMQDIATTIPTDFEVAANAVGEVNTRFGVTGQQLQDLSTRFVEFSELNNTDVSTSIDNTQKALSAFGLSADQAGMLLDVLNRTGQNTGVSVDALSEGLVQNSAAFQEMGLSIDQATVFMGQMETSGANSETVMQGLRRALKEATAEGIPMNEALINLQNTIANGTGSVDGLTAAYDLFGKSGDQIYNAVRNGSLDFTQLASSQTILKDSMDSVGQAYKDTVDPIDQAKMAMNDAKLVGADIVTTAMPMIKDALEGLRDILKDLKNWWDGLSQGQQENILKFAMIAAVVGPVISVLASLIGIISGISTALGFLTTTTITFEGVAFPLIAIIAAIVAAVAAVILVIKNWGKITEWLKGLWEGLKKAAGKVWNGITSVVGGAVKAVKDTVGKAWEGIKSVTGTVFGAVKDTIGGAFNKAKETATSIAGNIKDKVGSAWNSIKEKTGSAFGSVKDYISSHMQKASQNGQKYGNAISSKLGSAWDAIRSKTGSTFSNIRDTMGDLMGGAQGKVKGAIDKIRGFFNFKWSLPKLKLPHPKIKGRFSLSPPSVPSFSIDWYAKAYDRAAYYTNPTVREDGRGFGDRQGGEFAVGERHLQQAVRNGVAAASRNVSNNKNVTINMTVNGAPGQDVMELARIVTDIIKNAYEREDAVWA